MVNPKPAVFLLIGDDKYRKERAIEEIAASLLGGSSKGLDRKTFYGAETAVEEVLGYAATLPFASTKRVVVIKEFERLSQPDRSRLAPCLNTPPPTACLIIDTKDDSILKENPSLARNAGIIRFNRLTRAELSSEIRSLAASAGKKLSAGALGALLELAGPNILSLACEIDKLASHIGERKEIEKDDVEEMVGKPMADSAFDIARAVGKRDVRKAIGIIKEMHLKGKRPHEIIGLLCWYLKRLLKAHALRMMLRSDEAVLNALNVDSRFAGEFFDQLRSFDADQVKDKLNMLLEADLDIKSSRFDPELVLELAVVRLCLGR